MSLRLFGAGAALCVLSLLPRAASAQSWNAPEIRDLVGRAIARRTSVLGDSGLRSFRARAHGFVFFLGQLGEGFSDPPRLVKSDQLALEVYWRAPGLSKQIILGRRDRRDLPTDIQYHRDHLGIVQNNFGERIRFGDGDEVRDVPHPLGPEGPDLYDFALADSLSIQLPERTVRVYQVLVRPKDFGSARVAGILFLDIETAELVRFRFSFTPAAYLDHTLEDITVVLDNGLWFGKYWLPRRQEIEIRRRTSWLELPARGIIRGRWEIGSYEFNVDLPPGLFALGEPEIVNAPRAARDSFPWEGTIGAAIDSALGPVERADLDRVRGELARAAANHALTGLPGTRPAFGSISDLMHVNRVEGLTPGFGWVQRIGARRVALRTWASFGLSDAAVKGRASLEAGFGGTTLEFRGGSEIRDIGDEPVISRLVNSFLAQERGYDFGDYVRVSEGAVRVRSGGPAGSWAMTAGVQHATSVRVNAAPASGAYRPNPSLGGPVLGVVRIDASRRASGAAGSGSVEGGVAAHSRYVRVRGSGELTGHFGANEVQLGGWGGWGSSSLPVDRPFVLGGRGSLPGEPFRAWGGRYAVLGRLDLRFPIPFVAVPLGSFGSSGNRATAGPFIAAGWAGGPIPGAPWIPSQRLRAVAGAQFDLFHGVVRVEVGAGLRDGQVGVTADVRRDFWSIL